MDKLDDIKLVLKRNPALTYREFMIKFGLSVENIHFQNVKHKKEKQSEPTDEELIAALCG